MGRVSTPYNDHDVDLEEDRQKRKILPEVELNRRRELFEGINRQRGKEQVLNAIRAKQFPLFLNKENLSFEDLALDQRNDILEGWGKEDQKYRIIDYLERIAKAVEAIQQDTRLKNVRRGQLFGTRFLLPATNPLVQMDLVEPENTLNLPPGVSLDVPRIPVPKMTIVNEGPTGRVLIGTNLDANSTKAQVSVAPVSQYILDTGEPVIEFLNIRSVGSDVTVNIILEI